MTKPKVIYWERYHGDKRPATTGAWVWDDGTPDSYQFICRYDVLAGRDLDSHFIRTASKEAVDWFARNGSFNAVRYYNTR